MKKQIKILCILLLVISTSSFAQGGWKRQHYLQNSLTSSCGNAIETSGGNLIVIGITYDTLNGYGFNRLTLVGTDNTGNIQWRKDYGNKKFEYIGPINQNTLIKTSNGFYITLCAKDSNNKYIGAIIEFDYAGDTLWQRTYFSSTGDFVPQGITRSMDGGLLITGFIQYPLTTPVLILKTGIDGTELWRNEINKPIPNTHNGSGIVQDSTTGKIIIVGYQYIGNSTSWSTYGNVLFLDSLGNKLNQFNYNNADAGGFGSVIQLKDKNFLTGGSWFEQQVGTTSKYKGYLVKFDINGTIIWSKKYYSAAPLANMNTFYETQNGNLLINGFLDTFQIYRPELRLTLTDNQGKVKWQRSIGNKFSSLTGEWASSMNPTQDGGFVLTTFFPNMQSPHPYSIVKTDSIGCDTLVEYCKNPVGVDEFYNKTGFSFEMFPNPASDLVNLKFSAPLETTVALEISDVSGKVMEEISIQGQEEVQLRTLSYSAGIYFVRVLSEGQTINTKKLVIQK